MNALPFIRHSQVLPSVLAFSDPDKLERIRILAEDHADGPQFTLQNVTGNLPVWTPHGAFAAADILLEALQADDQPLSSHA